MGSIIFLVKVYLYDFEKMGRINGNFTHIGNLCP